MDALYCACHCLRCQPSSGSFACLNFYSHWRHTNISPSVRIQRKRLPVSGKPKTVNQWSQSRVIVYRAVHTIPTNCSCRWKKKSLFMSFIKILLLVGWIRLACGFGVCVCRVPDRNGVRIIKMWLQFATEKKKKCSLLSHTNIRRRRRRRHRKLFFFSHFAETKLLLQSTTHAHRTHIKCVCTINIWRELSV